MQREWWRCVSKIEFLDSCGRLGAMPWVLSVLCGKVRMCPTRERSKARSTYWKPLLQRIGNIVVENGIFSIFLKPVGKDNSFFSACEKQRSRH